LEIGRESTKLAKSEMCMNLRDSTNLVGIGNVPLDSLLRAVCAEIPIDSEAETRGINTWPLNRANNI